MSTLKNKIDFAVIMSVKNANPNGDPLSGNMPRMLNSGMGEMSDVCLKRKIRNRLQYEGENIFVQMQENTDDKAKSLKERFETFAKESKKEEVYQNCCEKWIDVRAFGQVFAFKDDNDSVSMGVRGPVSIQPAFSIDPIIVDSLQIIKSVNGDTPKKDGGKSSDTMGSKHRVEFGLYVTYGSINVELASKTGFTDQDAEKIKNALATLFRNDSSSARPEGSMEVVKLIWWVHNCPIGQYSSAKVHRSLKVAKKDTVIEPTSADDYDVTVTPLDGLNVEIIDGE